MSLENIVKEELSGHTAKSFVAQICRFHRIQGSTMFHEAAEYVKSELQKIGLSDAAILQFPADGKTKFWTHTSPVGWEVKSAELRQVEPEEKLLCTYEDVPQCLHTFSNATPPEGVTAELIDVGAGTSAKDYEGKNVKGKFVLATGRARQVHQQAVKKYDAAGVITDTCIEYPRVRESLDIPDAYAYQGIWPTAEDLPKTKFGFSISKRQGNALRALLKAGKKVKLRAKVEARLFKGQSDVVTATMRGKQKPNEEIFLIAHLCHPKPSANDNASGSGLLMEIARTIKRLIDTRKIPQPARTIRFFWVPETMGTVAYLSTYPEHAQKLVAGINLDMVGENQELCKSTLNLDRTPDSLPSFLNDYVHSLMEKTAETFDSQTTFGSSSTFRYRTTAFSGGSDHAEFTNSTTSVPCVMLLQWPDMYYHTSMDTIDKVSEDSLKRVGWITTIAAITLANAAEKEAYFFACTTASKGLIRIAEATTQILRELQAKTENPKLWKNKRQLAKEITETAAYGKTKIEHVVWREQQAVKSVKKLASTSELDAFIRKCCKDLAGAGKRETAKIEETLNYLAKTLKIKLAKIEETKAEKELKKLVPKRLFKGTLSSDYLKELLGEKEYEWYTKVGEEDLHFAKKMAEIINFMNGKRTAYDITKAVSAEYSPTNAEHVLKFLQDLEKVKLTKLH
ncbi:MAG: DUF4910 domain-containing protein [Candidatus Bathyarchaeia archaeon]